jgi:Tfp pilus assembly protein PilF
LQAVSLFESDTSAIPAEKEKINAVLLPVYLNLCATYLKLPSGSPYEVLEQANKAIAIAPSSAKALYRRAQSYMATQEYEKALADIKAAVKLEPRDAILRSLMKEVVDLIKRHREKEKMLFRGMFGGVPVMPAPDQTTVGS